MKSRKILVTSALPYANGSIHIGHVLESVITDIWVRYQNLNGNECLYFCADDTHGTPVMLKAKELGIDPEELIKRTREEHIKSYSDLILILIFFILLTLMRTRNTLKIFIKNVKKEI